MSGLSERWIEGENAYQQFLVERRDQHLGTLQRVLEAKKEELVLGPNGVVNDLLEVLECYIAPNVNQRRGQLISYGIRPGLTQNVDLNGSQEVAAFQIAKFLVGYQKVQIVAKGLKTEIEESGSAET